MVFMKKNDRIVPIPDMWESLIPILEGLGYVRTDETIDIPDTPDPGDLKLQDIKVVGDISFLDETMVYPDEGYDAMQSVEIVPILEIGWIPTNYKDIEWWQFGKRPKDGVFREWNPEDKGYVISVDDKIMFDIRKVDLDYIWNKPIGGNQATPDGDETIWAESSDIRNGKTAVTDVGGRPVYIKGDMPEIPDADLTTYDTYMHYVDVNAYVGQASFGIGQEDRWKLLPDNIRQGVTILGVTGEMLPYVAPSGTLKKNITENGIVEIDVAGYEKIILSVNVAGGGITEEEDDDDMTIIECVAYVDGNTNMITAVHAPENTYTVLNQIVNSSRPWAVKVRVHAYVDLSEFGIGYVHAVDVWLDVAEMSVDSSMEGFNAYVFRGVIGDSEDGHNPITLMLDCNPESNAGGCYWHHITNDGMVVEYPPVFFDL